MARYAWAQPRTFGIAVAVIALALAACGKKGTTTPAPGTTPTPTPLPSGVTAPPYGIAGVAYLPDGGASSTFHGIQVVHFEDYLGNLLGAPVAPPPNVAFSGPVGPVDFSSDETDALAAMEVSLTGGTPTAPPFSFVQSVNGVLTANLTPLGNPYDVAVAPSPYPTNCPSAPASSVSPTISDITGVAILGNGSSAVGLVLGPGTPGIVGLTTLIGAPPNFGCFVPFPNASPRANIQASSGAGVVLVRGPYDLMSLTVTAVGAGYSFAVGADDGSLGTGTVYRGHGAFAFAPNNAGRALVAHVAPPYGAVLITGLPSAISHASTVTLASAPYAVAISPNGLFGVIGASAGFYVVSGISSGVLTVSSPFAPSGTSGLANSPSYIDCNGHTANLQNVTSIGFSADGRYITALGNEPAGTCPSGNNATIVVMAFNESSGIPPTPGPSPTATAGVTPTSPPSRFTENNIISPPTGADYMLVR